MTTGGRCIWELWQQEVGCIWELWQQEVGCIWELWQQEVGVFENYDNRRLVYLRTMTTGGWVYLRTSTTVYLRTMTTGGWGYLRTMKTGGWGYLRTMTTGGWVFLTSMKLFWATSGQVHAPHPNIHIIFLKPFALEVIQCIDMKKMNLSIYHVSILKSKKTYLKWQMFCEFDMVHNDILYIYLLYILMGNMCIYINLSFSFCLCKQNISI